MCVTIGNQSPIRGIVLLSTFSHARGISLQASRLPPVQNLDFCLIGRKTKESLTGSFSHIPIGYMIACLTSGAISKQEAGMATVQGDTNSEFSAALTTSLEDLIHKSLKDECYISNPMQVGHLCKALEGSAVRKELAQIPRITTILY